MNTKIKIVLGTGGVGKTSISAALALGYAQRGLRTLVVTIDPSLRLRTTLQLDSGGSNQKIPIPHTEFYAGLLDSKLIFDEFVTRGLETPEKIQKLLNNRLYQQLSTNLSGSQEFTALEKLLSEYESGQWDRIVLDTPPAGHAIDFLRAPQKLNRLLDERIARWFRSPKDGGTFLGSLFQFGTKNLMRALEILTGSEFMTELSDFFDQIQFWQKKLESRLSKVQKLLISKETEFLLVTSFDSAKLKEALELLKTVRLEGLYLQTVIINRAYPFWFKKAQDLKLKSLETPLNYFTQRAQEGVSLLKSSRIPLKEVELPEYRYGINKMEDLSQISLALRSID